MYFGAIGYNLAQLISENTGVELSGYNLALSSDNVRKVFSDHGDEAIEALRGQRAIQESDFLLARDVITSPDSVVLSETTRDGKPVLEFSKHTGDRFVAITVVSDKHMDLSILTMYAGKRKGDLATALDKQVSNNTPEATSGTVPTESIPEYAAHGSQKKPSNQI